MMQGDTGRSGLLGIRNSWESEFVANSWIRRESGRRVDTGVSILKELQSRRWKVSTRTPRTTDMQLQNVEPAMTPASTKGSGTVPSTVDEHLLFRRGSRKGYPPG